MYIINCNYSKIPLNFSFSDFSNPNIWALVVRPSTARLLSSNSIEHRMLYTAVASPGKREVRAWALATNTIIIITMCMCDVAGVYSGNTSQRIVDHVGSKIHSRRHVLVSSSAPPSHFPPRFWQNNALSLRIDFPPAKNVSPYENVHHNYTSVRQKLNSTVRVFIKSTLFSTLFLTVSKNNYPWRHARVRVPTTCLEKYRFSAENVHRFLGLIYMYCTHAI
jgi:hypothetical protein